MTLFQEQYTELAKAIDEIAERIRALDVKAPGSFSEFTPLTSISEESGAPAAEVMIRQLASDHMTAARTALQVVTTPKPAAMLRRRISQPSAWRNTRRRHGCSAAFCSGSDCAHRLPTRFTAWAARQKEGLC